MRNPTRFFNHSWPREVQPGSVFYHPELDVLRFVAFLAVFMHHALPRDASLYIRQGLSPAATAWLLNAKEAGAFGVDLFFALSSYLITELLLREYASRGAFNISAFYVRRALRIWPLYFTFLAATVFVIPTILPKDSFGTLYIVSFAFFLGNWVCATYGIPFSVAGPMWSISVEEQFYIGWPLLLRVFGINRIKQLAIALLGVAVATRIFLAGWGVEHPGVWCNTLARLDPIAFGAILAVTLGGRAPQIKNTLRIGLGVGAFATWLLVARYLSQEGPSSILTYALSALAGVVLLVAVLQKNVPLLSVRPFSWLVYLGRISYGLYVFHLLALAVTMNMSLPVVGIPLGFYGRVISAFILTVILAMVSYTWLEEPFLRLKKRFTYKRATTPVRQQALPSGALPKQVDVVG